ncbi:MAG: M3 family metallopeptidase [Balneolales bacterium]
MRVPTLAGVCACMMLTSACAPDELSIMETNFTPDNPFFTASTLPFEAPDFDVIRIEHYRPAFEAGMERQLADIGEIAGNPAPPTFENTIAAMERTGTLLTRVSRVFFNMTSAHTNEEIQEIQAEIAPKLAAHSDDIHLNGRLFERIETLHDNIEQLDLGQEGRQLLRDIRRDFVRAGALLSDQEQDRVREINEKTSSLTTLFQENLLAVTRERAVITDHVEDLNGLSADRIAAAKEAAEDRGHEGKYLLSITNTTRQPILSSLDNREFRKRVWEASAYRGLGENGGVDNRPVILELVRLRAERARLLGHPDWASFALETQTAQTPANALEMMGRLVDPVLANTKQEAEQITARMRRDGIDDELQPWDWEYYAEKVRMDRYDIDEDEVRPYFELERVLHDGVFFTMNRLFGITFEERDDLPVYHPDVRVYDVMDEDGTPLGLFYSDNFARDSKRGGAWMSSFVSQSGLLQQKPVIVNVLNITKPAQGDPALISFDNVTTLFHEMGHAVHGLFSDVKYPSLSGTAVPRDFVEFPSTFQEDWAIEPEVLENYAVHYESGERIPHDLLDRVIAARDFNQGFDTQEYLAAALLDMEWHTLKTGDIPDDVTEFEQKALAKHRLAYPPVPPRYKSAFFSHIFSGGYSASYYAYIWSEVLAADAFAYMEEQSGLSRKNGDHYRQTILSRGGSKEAMDLYLDFRGQEPRTEHLLRRRGLDAGL